MYANNRLGLLREFEGFDALKQKKAIFLEIFKTKQLPAVEIKFLHCDDLLEVLKDQKLRIRDYHCIGDLSWEIRVAINPQIKNGLDWDEKLGTKFGVVPILKYVINHYVGCYSSWCYTMAFDRKTKIYEFSPIKLPKQYSRLKSDFDTALNKLSFVSIDERDFDTRISNVTTDTIRKGPVKFFDLVFTDIYGHEFEKSRFTTRPIKIDSTFREFTGAHNNFYEESVTLNNGDEIFLIKEFGKKARVTLTYKDQKGKKHKRVFKL